jgi:hypothetical protein
MQNKPAQLLVLWMLMLLSAISYSQNKKTTAKPAAATVKHEKRTIEFSRWSIKGGVNISVIYLARNVQESNNKPGFCGGITYEVNDLVRISGLYTHFRPIDIQPTWLNVKANTYEMNLEIMAKFPNKKTLVYPFVGLSYNTYNGFFTGESDYLNLKEYYGSNVTVKNHWLGFNIGAGLEHNFGPVGLFADYRMRLGKQENALNIMDVCYTAGLKIYIPGIKPKINYGPQNPRYLY